MWPIRLSFCCLCLSVTLLANAALWPSAIRRVEAELRAPDVEVRRRASRRLRDLPEQSALRLARAALEDQDIDVRLAALDAALQVDARGIGERVVPWLSDPERRLRLAAAQALAVSPVPRATAVLARALGDSDPAVRVAAATALGKSQARDTAIALLGHLDDAVPDVRVEVARALGELGDPRAVVPLIGKTEDGRPAVRAAVARALGELRDRRSVSALLLALRDSDELVRIEALGALAKIADPSAGLGVASLLQGGVGGRERSAALEALSSIATPVAVRALISELASDEPGRPRDAVIEALVRMGGAAAPALVQCLASESNPERADGCASALGLGRQASGSAAIRDALRRGNVRPSAALAALGALGARDALPTVLEYLSDRDLLTRRAAAAAAAGLLDPLQPDGRAVEPIERALEQARSSRADRLALTRLLGKTGSPRAARALAVLGGPNDDVELRVRALEGLGLLEGVDQSAVLIAALGDDAGSVRLAAALALFRVGAKGHAPELIERFERGAEQDRAALAIALGGVLARETDPSIAARVAGILQRSVGGERDALSEALGRMPGADAVQRLASILERSQDPADRAKFAEALAAHPEARERLLPLLADPDPGVRANAVWSLGQVGNTADVARLANMQRDAELRVVGNALGARARLAQKERLNAVPELCAALVDARAYVRAAALRALHLVQGRCPKAEELELLGQDRSESVREAAALLIRDVPRGVDDARALARARERDPSGRVVAVAGAAKAALPEGTEPTLMLIIPLGEDGPLEHAPFTLEFADGLLRFGIADRRGQVFEARAPRGTLGLLPDLPLAR